MLFHSNEKDSAFPFLLFLWDFKAVQDPEQISRLYGTSGLYDGDRLFPDLAFSEAVGRVLELPVPFPSSMVPPATGEHQGSADDKIKDPSSTEFLNLVMCLV